MQQNCLNPNMCAAVTKILKGWGKSREINKTKVQYSESNICRYRLNKNMHICKDNYPCTSVSGTFVPSKYVESYIKLKP